MTASRIAAILVVWLVVVTALLIYGLGDLHEGLRRALRRITLRRLLVLVAVSTVPIMILRFVFVSIPAAQEGARDGGCRGNLKQIHLALYNYHREYGCFPPAVTADAVGRPAHSWRTLVLPYYGRQELFARYDLAVPWNHPNNAGVAAYDPDIVSFYWCPDGDGRATKATDYVAVVGPHTAWPGTACRRITDITDDPSQTILVLECAGLGIPWLEPREPTLDGILASGVRGRHPGHFNAMFADGRVRHIRADITPATLRALLTIDGGEAVDPRDWQAP